MLLDLVRDVVEDELIQLGRVVLQTRPKPAW